MTNYRGVLRSLAEARVEFIVIGGVAGVLHGAARFTQDVDVVYARSEENLGRLATALAPHRPYPRGAPPGLPFQWDARTLRAGLNFTLQTSIGAVDVLGDVAGGTYDTLLAHAVPFEIDGLEVRVVDLPTLIRLKKAAGRPKDLEAIAELELLLAQRLGPGGGGLATP